MGYERSNLSVSVLLSRHNSERDIEHDLLWEELVKEIEAVVNQPKFERISPMIG